MPAPFIKVKVPHGNYDVSKLNTVTGVKDPAEAAVICFNRKVESGSVVNDCEMHIQADITGDSMNYFIIDYNAESDLTIEGDSSS
jgi:hypothetical protein